jgi:glutaredoxin 2
MNNNMITTAAAGTTTSVIEVIEVIDNTGMINLEALREFRAINSKINDASTKIKMATSAIENMKNKGFFKALGMYMDGRSYMTYDGKKDITMGNFEKLLTEYNKYIVMIEKANKDIDELSEALEAYRVPDKYSDLMAESISGEWEEV